MQYLTTLFSQNYNKYKIAVCIISISLSTVICGNSPYPIIFIHGLDSEDETWGTTITQLEAFYGDFNEGHIFHAVLNAYEDMTDIYGPDGIEGTIDDDVIVSFDNENNELLDGNIYAINFDNFWNQVDTIPLIEYYNSEAPGILGESDGNQSSIYKQGYALKKCIEAVLNASSSDKVILVGHSMGGLTAREYLQRKEGDENIWWINPNEPDRHKVAKLVTIGTPHLGSNLFELRNQVIIPNPNSEAVRDLRWEYNGDDGENLPGVYLFGGNEADIEENSTFHNYDVNCNGFETDGIIGISDGTTYNIALPLPLNIEYTWITSNLNSLGGDGFVDLERQWLYNGDIPAPENNADTLLIDKFHLDETEDYVTIIRGLDEPDSFDLAYEIGYDEQIIGFITHQPDMIALDNDVFKLSNDYSAYITITVENSNSGVEEIAIYDENENLLNGSSISSFPFTISANVLLGGDTYIEMSGTATGNTYLNPYSIIVTRIIDLGQVSISGYVQTVDEEGIENVVMTFNNEGGTVTTDNNGFYSNDVPEGWSGILTPTLIGYDFDPPDLTFNDLTGDTAGNNFTGSNITGFIYFDYRQEGFHIIHRIQPDGSYWDNIQVDADNLDVTDDGEYLLYKSILYPPYGNYELVKKSLIETTSDTAIYLPYMNRTNWAVFSENNDIIYSNIVTNIGDELHKYDFTNQSWTLISQDPEGSRPYKSPDGNSFGYYINTGVNEFDNVMILNMLTGDTTSVASNGIAFSNSSSVAWTSSDYIYYQGQSSVDQEFSQLWRTHISSTDPVLFYNGSDVSYNPVALKNDRSKIVFSSIELDDQGNDLFVCKLFLYDEIIDTFSELHEFPNNYYVSNINSSPNENKIVFYLDYEDIPGEQAGVYIFDIDTDILSFLYDGRNPIWSGEGTSSDLVTVWGFIQESDGTGINGVTLSFSNGGGTTSTNADGFYNYNVTLGWSGSVTPSLEGWVFDPPSRSYSNVTSGQDSQNYIGTQTDTIEVPMANFTPDTQQTGIVPFEVNFTDNSINTPTSWLWHFGDGAIDNVQNPSHTYNQTGIYTVSLKASNAWGSDLKVKQAHVWVIAEHIISLPDSLDLNVTPGSESVKTTRIYGDDPYDYSGRGVSSGDVNGDGYTDVIIGAYLADPTGGLDAGETYIIYGWVGMEGIQSIDLNGESLIVTRIYGDDPYDYSGRGVSSGDVNGDGYTDVIIGAYLADPFGRSNAGETYVIYGSAGMESIPDIDLEETPSNVTRICGKNPGDHSGRDVSSGDINGDGFSDVIIGARYADPFGRSNAGETYVIYGSANIEDIQSIDLNFPASYTLTYISGEFGNSFSGGSVSNGDINGDGYSDIILGATHAHVDAGVTYIVYGSVLIESISIIDLDGTLSSVTRIYGDDPYDYSSGSHSSGDINGDGYADVIIGAPFADPLGRSDAGETYIIYGSAGMESETIIDLDGTPSNVTRIYGDDADDNSGIGLSSGDINGDGYADVIIGAPLADPTGRLGAGETYIIYGSAGIDSETIIDLDGTPSNVTRIYGDDADDNSGIGLSSGDFNGDGYTDVFIGACQADPGGGHNAGETYIIYGGLIDSNQVRLNVEMQLPAEYRLSQNYPNPFNPTTSIRYDLPEDAYVRITVYDLLGRQIINLVNADMTAGYRSALWNGTDTYGKPVSSGMYIYQIQAGSFVQSKKMVLLK